MSNSDEMVRAALTDAGVPFIEGDLELLRVLEQVFEPAMRALDAADLAELPLEADLDPGRPPRGALFS